MTTPINNLPDWSREIEYQRIANTDLYSADISRVAGRSPSWWSYAKTRVKPPRQWPLMERKIKKLLDSARIR